LISYRFVLLLLIHLVIFGSANDLGAQDRQFTLIVSPELNENGFLKYLLPRFALKTGTRAVLIDNPGADVQLTNRPGNSENSRAAFTGQGQTYFLRLSGNSGHGKRFSDWLLSDIGQRTVAAFTVDGVQKFSKAKQGERIVVEILMDGNAQSGALLALEHCGRCHVIGEINRMKGIGSTPSFGLLRTFPDWEYRFGAFYTLNPHPSFSQIADVTAPFDRQSPPPIIPLRLTLDELEDILAYVAGIEPADLGRPIVHQ